MKMYGVTFGDEHSYYDWGVYLSGVHISLPEPRIITVDVPYSNGLLDVTMALSNRIFYKPREVTYDFTVIDCKYTWPELYSKVAGLVHGRALKVVSDTDPDWYWDAYYCELETPTAEEDVGRFSIKCTCFPYKLAVRTTKVKFTVDSPTASLELHHSRMETSINIECSNAIKMSYVPLEGGSAQVELKRGMNEDVCILSNFNNVLFFNKTSSSNVDLIITYREGEL